MELWKIPKELQKSNDDEKLLGLVINQLKNPQGFIELVESLYKAPLEKSEDILEFKDGRYFFRSSYPLIENNVPTARIWNFRDFTDLRTAQIEAKKADKAKSEFLANMSHEIRTPMNGIIGMVKILKNSNLPNEFKDILSTIDHSSEILLKILNDVLDISKIEAGKIQLEAIHFNLKKVLTESINLFASQASIKEISLEFHYPKHLPEWFLGDEIRLRQIVVNFLSNATKFTHKGRIQVGVDLLDHQNEDYHIKIHIDDSGEGISKEAQKNLFEAFTQADSSITRKHGGTGLGLTICSKLAKLMNGEISFTSKEGMGSTFNLHINLKAGIEQNSQSKQDKEEQFKNLAKEYPHSILLVEDNLVNQQVAGIILKKLGYTCDFSHNGLDCLDKLKQVDINSYSLIFMDMQMPELDGISTTKKMIELYGEKVPPIIALTANAFEKDRKKCLQAGMQDFLTKPLKLDSLIRVLKKYSN